MPDKRSLVAAEEPSPDVRAIVDIHAHPLTPRYHKLVQHQEDLGEGSRFSYRSFLPPRLPEWSPENALETMTRYDLRAQVLSLPDATVELRGDAARRMARETNEMLAEIVEEHPGKFAALAALPLDDPDDTLAELGYALDVLHLDGIAVTANIRGTYLSDDSNAPWLQELHRRAAVLFVHPTASAAMVPLSPMFIEFSFDSTRMVINMVLSGAKRRYSKIKIVSTHGGGAIPFLSSRLEMLAPALLAGDVSREDIVADLRSFYYDLTSCMAEAPLAAATRFVPPSHLMLGFDLPFLPATSVAPQVQRFSEFDGISEQAKFYIASESALSLFPRLQTPKAKSSTHVG